MWNPIQSCPYDIPVLVYGFWYRERNASRNIEDADRVGVFMAIRRSPEVDDDGFIIPCDDVNDIYSDEPFDAYGGEYYFPQIRNATHWMPVPQNPNHLTNDEADPSDALPLR